MKRSKGMFDGHLPDCKEDVTPTEPENVECADTFPEWWMEEEA